MSLNKKALILLSFLTLVLPVHSFYSYANDFIAPEYFLQKKYGADTVEAQATIISWAAELADEAPWSVMNKTITPPTGSKHDYESLAPYWWPDCSSVGNTTQLTPEQIWTTCPYVQKDGQFNPDVRQLANDVGEFSDMSDAIFYSAMAWAFNGSSIFSSNVANYINVWFLDPATSMTPNLNYGQVQRGPGKQNGTHTGVLDLKCMTKIVSGILILRNGKAPEWTSDLDSQFVTWVLEYITWLQTADIAIQERNSTNNHGTFYFNQLAALQIYVGDQDGANSSIAAYFTGIYLGQIAANGDQPLESARTRPYHYRAYNLAAMITNARIGEYVGYNAWNLTTTAGGTIKSALDYAMTQPAGADDPTELYSVVAAVASQYGDPTGKYAAYLLKNAGNTYPAQAYFLWDQPLTDSGLVKTATTSTTSSARPTSSGTAPAGDSSTATLSRDSWTGWMFLYYSCTVVMILSVSEFF